MYGAGRVAAQVAYALEKCDRIIKYSVASRNVDNAEKFKSEYGFKTAYSYDDLLNDICVDFVYISTPTEMHYEDIKKCLLHNKHVICEKTLTTNSAEAKELFELAEKNNLILLDAIWTLYMPMYQQINDLKKHNTLGRLKYVFASFGYPGLNHSNLLNPIGGGAILDKGIYGIAVANKFFDGDIKRIQKKNKIRNSVDYDSKIKIEYEGGKALVHSSIIHRTSYLLIMKYDKGVLFSKRFWNGKQMYIWRYPFSIKRSSYSFDANGYEYEFCEMVRLMDGNTIESSILTHEDSLKNMYVVDIAKQ